MSQIIFYERPKGSDGKPLPKGGVTVVIDTDRRRVGMAICSRRDAFCKRTGRKLAEACCRWDEVGVEERYFLAKISKLWKDVHRAGAGMGWYQRQARCRLENRLEFGAIASLAVWLVIVPRVQHGPLDSGGTPMQRAAEIILRLEQRADQRQQAADRGQAEKEDRT